MAQSIGTLSHYFRGFSWGELCCTNIDSLKPVYTLPSSTLRCGKTHNAIFSVYRSPNGDSKDNPQNIDLPVILPKRKKKPYPVPLKEMRKIAKSRKLLQQQGIQIPIEPPKNGLLVPGLVPVAYEVLNSWKIIVKNVPKLISIIPVHVCSQCSSIHIAENGHSIKDCLGSKSSSRQSLHSWVKASINDVLLCPESYHMYDPFGKRITHETRFNFERIPALMELCLQAGVELPDFPSFRRTEPITFIGKKIRNERKPHKEPPKQTNNQYPSSLVDYDPNEAFISPVLSNQDVPRIAQETMDAYERVRNGLRKLMKKYSVKACGYCAEVHVGPWGHSAKLCGEHKHQWRDGKHGWQEAVIDEVLPPNYVWHCKDPKGPPLSNLLKRFYGKAYAVVELCMQGGAEVPEVFKPMMRLDIIVPDSFEADLIA